VLNIVLRGHSVESSADAFSHNTFMMAIATGSEEIRTLASQLTSSHIKLSYPDLTVRIQQSMPFLKPNTVSSKDCPGNSVRLQRAGLCLRINLGNQVGVSTSTTALINFLMPQPLEQPPPSGGLLLCHAAQGLRKCAVSWSQKGMANDCCAYKPCRTLALA
jgi:hypothetical protein